MRRRTQLAMQAIVRFVEGYRRVGCIAGAIVAKRMSRGQQVAGARASRRHHPRPGAPGPRRPRDHPPETDWVRNLRAARGASGASMSRVGSRRFRTTRSRRSCASTCGAGTLETGKFFEETAESPEPELRRIAPHHPVFRIIGLWTRPKAAAKFGLATVVVAVKGPQDLDGAIKRAAASHPDALIVVHDVLTVGHRTQIARLALQY